MRNIKILFFLLMLAACNKEGVLKEQPDAKILWVKYFAVNNPATYRITVNNKPFGDSLLTGQSIRRPMTGDQMHIEIKDHHTGAFIRDTLISSPGNKEIVVSLLNLSNNGSASPEILIAAPTEDTGKTINWSFYIDNSSGVFPDSAEIKIVRLNVDVNTWDLDGTADTLATLPSVKPGKLSNFVSLDLSGDKFMEATTYPAIYMYQVKDARTGLFVPGGEIDISTLGTVLGYNMYEESYKHYISIMSGIKEPAGSIILNSVVLTY